MGVFINGGISRFRQTLGSEIYVDKTDMIDFLNRVLNTEQKCICVSRPRRFGKSITANMIAAYYEKESDSRSLFEGRKLSNDLKYKISGKRDFRCLWYLSIFQRTCDVYSIK